MESHVNDAQCSVTATMRRNPKYPVAFLKNAQDLTAAPFALMVDFHSETSALVHVVSEMDHAIRRLMTDDGFLNPS